MSVHSEDESQFDGEWEIRDPNNVFSLNGREMRVRNTEAKDEQVIQRCYEELPVKSADGRVIRRERSAEFIATKPPRRVAIQRGDGTFAIRGLPGNYRQVHDYESL